MKKKIGFSLLAIAVLIVIAGIYIKHFVRDQNANMPAETPGPIIEGQNSPTPDPTDAPAHHNNVDHMVEKDIPIEHLKVDHTMLTDTFVAPNYVDNDQIAFELIESNVESTSHIVVVDRNNQAWKTVYTAPPKHVVDTLVGIDKNLFWVEHVYERQIDTAWVIKMLSLQTGEINEIQSGVAEDEILPPVLRIDDGLVTWISKRIENDVVISTAFAYNPKDQVTTSVATAELNEQNGREGTFFILQRPIKEGLLIHQSVFFETTEPQKKFQIVLYPYDHSEPQVMAEDVSLVDFTANSEYFAWTESGDKGKVSVMDRATGKIIYEINDPKRDLTFDSPFIRDGLLYYRYSVDSIYALDLETGIEHEVAGKKSIHSKLFNSEGYIGFSYRPAIEPENEVEFFILPVESTE